MPVHFFDTNALIKAYIHEQGSPWIHQVMAVKLPPPRIFISELTRVEVPSALYKIERLRGYSSAFTDTAINTFVRDLRLSVPSRRYKVYEIIPLSDALLAQATGLLAKYRTGTPYALRSLDALQLASAVIARFGLPSAERADAIFVTVDRQLRGVAAAEGFQTVNPEHPPGP